jgi:hypothetical protein
VMRTIASCGEIKVFFADQEHIRALKERVHQKRARDMNLPAYI